MNVLSFTMIIGFLLTGCVRTKIESNIKFNMDTEEFKILQSQCEEINSHGDILSLYQEIKNEVREVLRLLENPLKGARFRINALAESIEQKSKKMRSLSKSEWTKARWDHEVIWRIDQDDYKNAFGHFGLDQVDLEGIYFMAEKRNDLTEKVFVEKTWNMALVKYKNLGSSLEICQLEKTLIIVLGVYTSSMNIKKHQFFSLTVRNNQDVI